MLEHKQFGPKKSTRKGVPRVLKIRRYFGTTVQNLTSDRLHMKEGGGEKRGASVREVGGGGM